MGRASRAAAVQREARCLRLAAEGKKLQAIADEVGYRHRGNVSRVISRALRETIPKDVELLRHEEGDRLDRMIRSLWPRAMAGDVAAVNAVHKLVVTRIRLFSLAEPEKAEAKAEEVVVLDPAELVAMAEAGQLDQF